MEIEGDATPAAAEPGAEDEVVWSRTWEWPAWMSTARAGLARAARPEGWHPDPRTLALLLVVFNVLLAGEVAPEAKPFLNLLTAHVPAAFDTGQFRWDRVEAWAGLLEILGSVLSLVAAGLIFTLPRRLPGYLVGAVATLVLLCGRIIFAVLVYHEVNSASARVGYSFAAATEVALLALLAWTASVPLRERALLRSEADVPAPDTT